MRVYPPAIHADNSELPGGRFNEGRPSLRNLPKLLPLTKAQPLGRKSSSSADLRSPTFPQLLKGLARPLKSNRAIGGPPRIGGFLGRSVPNRAKLFRTNLLDQHSSQGSRCQPVPPYFIGRTIPNCNPAVFKVQDEIVKRAWSRELSPAQPSRR
jgi:hypothetical protein